MEQTHAGRPAPEGSTEKRRAVARPRTPMPAGPDYWPVPTRATVVRRRVEELSTARELHPEPAT
ncbi:MAG TPA: hypothetical protein VFR87_08220 [Nocardioidaceae bacterium]|nr:hypothetical protein [Nocardioidaceae bacterium]